MNFFSRLNAWVAKQTDWLFDLIRIYLGIGLFVKAIYFINHKEYLFNLLNGAGHDWYAEAIIIHYVILAHLAGGFCMTLGILTRFAALVQIPVLAGAVFLVHLPQMKGIDPRQNLEFSALVLFLLILIFIRGGGPLALDNTKSGEDQPVQDPASKEPVTPQEAESIPQSV